MKRVDKDGTIRYTTVLISNVTQTGSGFAVYSNPVPGRTINWQATLPGGTYLIQARDSKGQQVAKKLFEHRGGNYTGPRDLPAALTSGTYYLMIGNSHFLHRQKFTVL